MERRLKRNILLSYRVAKYKEKLKRQDKTSKSAFKNNLINQKQLLSFSDNNFSPQVAESRCFHVNPEKSHIKADEAIESKVELVHSQLFDTKVLDNNQINIGDNEEKDDLKSSFYKINHIDVNCDTVSEQKLSIAEKACSFGDENINTTKSNVYLDIILSNNSNSIINTNLCKNELPDCPAQSTQECNDVVNINIQENPNIISNFSEPATILTINSNFLGQSIEQLINDTPSSLEKRIDREKATVEQLITNKFDKDIDFNTADIGPEPILNNTICEKLFDYKIDEEIDYSFAKNNQSFTPILNVSNTEYHEKEKYSNLANVIESLDSNLSQNQDNEYHQLNVLNNNNSDVFNNSLQSFISKDAIIDLKDESYSKFICHNSEIETLSGSSIYENIDIKRQKVTETADLLLKNFSEHLNNKIDSFVASSEHNETQIGKSPEIDALIATNLSEDNFVNRKNCCNSFISKIDNNINPIDTSFDKECANLVVSENLTNIIISGNELNLIKCDVPNSTEKGLFNLNHQDKQNVKSSIYYTECLNNSTCKSNQFEVNNGNASVLVEFDEALQTEKRHDTFSDIEQAVSFDTKNFSQKDILCELVLPNETKQLQESRGSESNEFKHSETDYCKRAERIFNDSKVDLKREEHAFLENKNATLQENLGSIVSLECEHEMDNQILPQIIAISSEDASKPSISHDYNLEKTATGIINCTLISSESKDKLLFDSNIKENENNRINCNSSQDLCLIEIEGQSTDKNTSKDNLNILCPHNSPDRFKNNLKESLKEISLQLFNINTQLDPILQINTASVEKLLQTFEYEQQVCKDKFLKTNEEYKKEVLTIKSCLSNINLDSILTQIKSFVFHLIDVANHLNENIIAKEEEIDNLNKSVQMASLKSKILEDNIDYLNRQSEAAKISHKEDVNTIISAKNSILNVQEQLNQVSKLHCSLYEKCNNIQAMNNENIQNFKDQIDSLKVNLVRIKESFEEIETSKYKDELVLLLTNIENEYQTEIGLAKKNIDELVNENVALKIRNADLEGSNTKLVDYNKELTDEVNIKQAYCVELERSVDDLLKSRKFFEDQLISTDEIIKSLKESKQKMAVEFTLEIENLKKQFFKENGLLKLQLEELTNTNNTDVKE